jgi:hypothetical protein
VADGTAGISVVNVASPLSPSVVTTIPTGGEVLGVTVDGARLYVADREFGLLLFDLSSPASPQPLGSLELYGAGSVVIDGTRAYVGAYGELDVVDVSNPMAPSLIGAQGAGDSQHALLLDGDRVYLGGQGNIFYLFDVSDPAQPREIGFQFSHGEAAAFGRYQDVIYAADPSAGIHVLSRACVATTGVPDVRPVPAGLIVRAAFPNPFREQIEFVIGGAVSGGGTTGQSVALRASILDVTGRLVRHLPVPTASGDEPHLSWDGRDDAGQITPAGVYFLRVNDARSLETRRFVRMR